MDDHYAPRPLRGQFIFVTFAADNRESGIGQRYHLGILHSPWSQRSPPQPSSQVHCHGSRQVPCLQAGCLLHSSQKVPCQPSRQLQKQTKTFSYYENKHRLHLYLGRERCTYSHSPGFEQFPFVLLHPSRQIAETINNKIYINLFTLT